MKISLIAAMSTNRVISLKGQLPWHMPDDLKYFKKMTLHKPIIMGRKTFDALGKALPNRRNIVITRNPSFVADNCEVYDSLEKSIDAAKSSNCEIMITGGAIVYEQALEIADYIYLTIIEHQFDGDTFFPKFDNKVWKIEKTIVKQSDDKNPYSCKYLTFVKNKE